MGRYFDQPADPTSGTGIAVNALSCGSTALCVAVDSDGGALSLDESGGLRVVVAGAQAGCGVGHLLPVYAAVRCG